MIYLVLLFGIPPLVVAKSSDTESAIEQFKNKMVAKHSFDKHYLDHVFSKLELRDSIIKAITRPAESKPWHEYRKIFLTRSRIKGGVEFWNKHEQAISDVASHYGVPAEIMVAILGVETRYGGNTGSYPVLDALSTLAFLYPKRSRFFRSELEQFLLLAREEGVEHKDLTGSYAGAMGLPQFMPSSFRNFAVDFDDDKRRDIWTNPTDTLASIANYFIKHGWLSGQPVALRLNTDSAKLQAFLTDGLKPTLKAGQLTEAGISLAPQIKSEDLVKLLEYDTEQGKEYWVGLENFYTITRYNHSQLYAMAVFQLSQEILNRKNKQKSKK
ncbi:MAG: lytic murein transglycosylase B [Gammaproteobacteria bacterium]|nr:lytic murein transglycosylase B [Gammaproteobacteria bacterium]